MAGRLRVGTSGYHYDHWRGSFYPEGLPKSRWLERYAERFDAVELNGTFYGLPEPETVDAWREAVPEGFLFAVKLSRYATHMKKLLDPEQPIAHFLEVVERLDEKLGPILVQLPPHFHANPARLDAFLDAAPSRHRWAVEVRDPSWLCEPVYQVLADHGAALVIHDLIDDHPDRRTADWLYFRFHGPGPGPYQGSYSHQLLTARARRMRRELDAGRDVYAFFNNDEGGCAPKDARELLRYAR